MKTTMIFKSGAVERSATYDASKNLAPGAGYLVPLKRKRNFRSPPHLPNGLQMKRYIAEVQVMLTLEIESALPSVETLAAILDSFADPHGPDPLLGAPLHLRCSQDRLMARTRGVTLVAGSALIRRTGK
jgi:hypothetical protein